jgi:hypothetical protein
MWQIIHLVIKRFEILLYMNFKIVRIDDVCYEELFNLLIYESIREKLFKNNMLILYLLNKRSQFITVK